MSAQHPLITHEPVSSPRRTRTDPPPDTAAGQQTLDSVFPEFLLLFPAVQGTSVRSRDSSISPCRTQRGLVPGQEEVTLSLRLMVEKIKPESFLETGDLAVRV